MTIFQVLVFARDSSISRFTSLTPYHFQGIRYFGELFIKTALKSKCRFNQPGNQFCELKNEFDYYVKKND